VRVVVRPKNSAIAVVIVMITIAALAGLAGLFAFMMKVETKLARNAKAEAQLTWLGRSGVEYARWVLAQQLSVPNEPYDALNQIWAGGPGTMNLSNSPLAEVSLDNYQLGNGKFSIKITDLERKFNINMANDQILQQALVLVGLDASQIPVISDSVQDWIDNDDVPRVEGAENSYYQGLNPPYYAKDGPIDDLSELLLIRGVTPEIYWGPAYREHSLSGGEQLIDQNGQSVEPQTYPVGLVDLFTAVSSGRININTASETELQLIPLVDENIASQIVQLRAGPDGADGTDDDTPFQNVGELVNAGLSAPVVQQISRYCTVRSSTFKVEVDAEVGGARRRFYAILGRNNPKDVQVLSFYWE